MVVELSGARESKSPTLLTDQIDEALEQGRTVVLCTEGTVNRIVALPNQRDSWEREKTMIKGLRGEAIVARRNDPTSIWYGIRRY